MSTAYHDPPGALVDAHDLQSRLGREIALLAGSSGHPWLECLEYRKIRVHAPADVVVVELRVEVPQRREYDIRSVERVAVILPHDKDKDPEVWALRDDFPVTPHQNIDTEERPRKLCLDDQGFIESRYGLSGFDLIERIRHWLSATARGDLHQESQAVEPAFIEPRGILVLSQPLTDGEDRAVALLKIPNEMGLMVCREFPGALPDGVEPHLLALSLSCEPQVHGIIWKQPQTLGDLQEIANRGGLNLVEELSGRLKRLHLSGSSDDLARELLLVIGFPKTRVSGGDVEVVDRWAFGFRGKSGMDVACALGVADRIGEHEAFLLASAAGNADLSIKLDCLKVHGALDRETAKCLQGFPTDPDDPHIVAVGVGALGSQVVANLARGGWGRWTLVDRDILLPHNLGRHACLDPQRDLGLSKAEVLSDRLNSMMPGDIIAEALMLDLLKPGPREEELKARLTNVSLIIDMSASQAVWRHLCHEHDALPRCASLFLNQTGTDCVLLMEDAERSVTMDAIEAQYLNLVAKDERLLNHFGTSAGAIRYSGSCRDLSVAMPQWIVGAHAGLVARVVQCALRNDNALISLQRIDPNSLEVNSVLHTPEVMEFVEVLGWTINITPGVISWIRKIRCDKLPNETGGILLGRVDHHYRSIHIVEATDAPSDSQEYPHAFIRGHHGLSRHVETISKRTFGNIQYCGEWHSHPQGCGVVMSADDQRVISWIGELMNPHGLPGLLLICGDHEIGIHLLNQGDSGSQSLAR